jgi:hypothetical protein
MTSEHEMLWRIFGLQRSEIFVKVRQSVLFIHLSITLCYEFVFNSFYISAFSVVLDVILLSCFF